MNREAKIMCAFSVNGQWYELPRTIVKACEKNLGPTWTNAKIIDYLRDVADETFSIRPGTSLMVMDSQES